MVAKNCSVYSSCTARQPVDRYMPDKPLRPQLNIRLDKNPSLLDDIKQAASDR
jgi:hypothetical protein